MIMGDLVYEGKGKITSRFFVYKSSMGKIASLNNTIGRVFEVEVDNQIRLGHDSKII
jgi:hypothetical protein